MGDEKGPLIISYKGDKDYEIPQGEEHISKLEIQKIVSKEIYRLLNVSKIKNKHLGIKSPDETNLDAKIQNIVNIIYDSIEFKEGFSVYDEKLWKEEITLIISAWAQLLSKNPKTNLRIPNLLNVFNHHNPNPKYILFGGTAYTDVVIKLVKNIDSVKNEFLEKWKN